MAFLLLEIMQVEMCEDAYVVQIQLGRMLEYMKTVFIFSALLLDLYKW